MARYCLLMELEEEELENIMKRLTEAQQEIMKCYSELQRLGVLKIKKSATTESDGMELPHNNF